MMGSSRNDPEKTGILVGGLTDRLMHETGCEESTEATKFARSFGVRGKRYPKENKNERGRPPADYPGIIRCRCGEGRAGDVI